MWGRNGSTGRTVVTAANIGDGCDEGECAVPRGRSPTPPTTTGSSGRAGGGSGGSSLGAARRTAGGGGSPGSGGAAEIAIHAQRVLIISRLSARAFPEKVDFLTSPRPRMAGRTRKELGMPGAGPVKVITDKAILDQKMTPLSADARANGGVDGSGPVIVVDHTSDNNLMAFRYKFADVKMAAAEDDFEAAGHRFRAGAFIIANADRALSMLKQARYKAHPETRRIVLR